MRGLMRFLALLFILFLTPAWGQMAQPPGFAGSESRPPHLGICTLSPVIIAYGSLTNNNLTFTVTPNAGYPGDVASLVERRDGLWHVEFTDTVNGGTSGEYGFGLATNDLLVNFGLDFLGISHSVGIFNDGTVWANGIVIASTGVTWTAVNTIIFEVDLNTQLLWFMNLTTSSYWNGSATATPATETGGISFSGAFPARTPVYFGFLPFYSSATVGDAGTVNFGGSAFAQTPTAGFTAWCLGY